MLTIKDFAKLAIPGVWGGISIAAVIAYAVYHSIASALFAGLSALLSLLFVYDIWTFHIGSAYAILYQEQKRKDIVFFKIIGGICLAVCSFVIFLASEILAVQFQTFSGSSAVWTVAGVLLSLAWVFDLYWFHYRERTQVPDTEEAELTEN